MLVKQSNWSEYYENACAGCASAARDGDWRSCPTSQPETDVSHHFMLVSLHLHLHLHLHLPTLACMSALSLIRSKLHWGIGIERRMKRNWNEIGRKINFFEQLINPVDKILRGVIIECEATDLLEQVLTKKLWFDGTSFDTLSTLRLRSEVSWSIISLREKWVNEKHASKRTKAKYKSIENRFRVQVI